MKLGILLNDLSTNRLLQLSGYSDVQPRELLIQAIDTMYKTMTENVVANEE